ncbi:MAG: hypothetical protein HZA17_11700 [Nitrospirae bacterium]|nr:hypothetical protein [Nitrospirota bacterium]
MKIAEATKDDIQELCALLGLLFAQEAEFRPDQSLQSTGLQQIIRLLLSGDPTSS